MADTITLPASGTGTATPVVATDDAGVAGHVQVIKLAISADGSATVIGADVANGLDVDVTRLPALPAGSNNIGDVDVLTVPADPFGATGDATVAAGATGSISAKLRRVTQGLEDLKTLTVPIEKRAATSTVTAVSDTNSSTQLLATNANRLGLRITNDSSAAVYVKYGTTASTTSYTVKLNSGDYFEDNQYTGRIDGIWATDPNDGAARITELSA